MNRDIVLIDAYAGLRRIGYTYLGAIRALRTLGVTYEDAKGAADTIEGNKDKVEECPRCNIRRVLSDEPEGAVTFEEAICGECRSDVLKESEKDAFDHAYDRARANGWAD